MEVVGPATDEQLLHAIIADHKEFWNH